jgi:hypothetical protein
MIATADVPSCFFRPGHWQVTLFRNLDGVVGFGKHRGRSAVLSQLAALNIPVYRKPASRVSVGVVRFFLIVTSP